ncbi:MAG TPA: LacI family DNA-binding transcriptional regulator [Pseudolysinimonas sp.]|jgi:LacI family transcriptional regulator|nr:LacI family DNA-binding transcriptional regulator [Pseudolysinimonas sp.]
MSTIRDVARVAEVSISTVSHVLNETRPVEPATRARVVAAIAETGYRRDALARALRRSRTDTIGLVVSDVGEPAFAGMIHGVEQAVGALDLGLVLASSGEGADREDRAVQTLLNRRVDGLILARAVESHDSLLSQLEREKSPTVLLDRIYPSVALDQVGVDNRSAMAELVQHLVGKGHRRLAIVAGDLRVPTLAERLAGVRDGIGRADVTVLSGVDGDALRSELDMLLRRGETTAIIASSTPLATIALDAMMAAGLRTPDDIAFATFDGFDQHPMFTPSLTTIRQPASDIGAAAVQLLYARMGDAHRKPRVERLQATLELRDSTEGYSAAN